ncbi:Glycosyl phosphatidyl inositol anchor synthesis [Ascosphaera pollenicola]|nr:Glycosyl phosphatidyl inositol anchor synthesis [Ascosphaera pollenicola]
MARLGRAGFLAIAVVFHLIYTYSIFDIYFVSPIVSGMRPHGVPREAGAKPPAKRLFLFVGDGLRADKAFQFFPDPSPDGYIRPKIAGADDKNGAVGDGTAATRDQTLKPLAPFIRSRVLHHGTFGVSHTRVPTESRPGHVALIAGLYEDVSAVTTGWKLNPVNFDSVFNRSRHTWSWGSPDILPMFQEGATPGRVDADMYGEEAEDFSSDATKLDTWVFDKVKEVFAAARTDPVLAAKLREDKLVFFLHLLGLDTTGHSYRPYSQEYLHNIKVVDQGISEITDMIESFYGDDQTAFVFTADHGMSDWGSHGDGHPDNTRTPLVAWGAGVAKPNMTYLGTAPGHEDGFSADWHLNHVQRHDVAQADVAALMAYLVGLDFPVNSVGELPLSYLDADPKEKALAALANAKGVLETYHVKEEKKREALIRFTPFPSFSVEAGGKTVEAHIKDIEDLIDQGAYDESIIKSQALLKTGIQGLRYLQTYDWLFLRAIVTIGYLGWIVYALTTVIDLHVLHSSVPAQRTISSNIFFTSVLVALCSVFWVQKSSWRYYVYGIFPIFFWEEVVANRKSLYAGGKVVLGNVHSFGGYIKFLLKAVLYVGILEALVASYFYREIYTGCYLLGGLWPLTVGFRFAKSHKSLLLMWIISCGLMSGFTLLPVVKTEDIDMVTYGGVLMFLTGFVYLMFEESIIRSGSNPLRGIISKGSRNIMGVQIGIILLAIIVTRSSITSLQAKEGLPFGNQVLGWIVMSSSLIVPFIYRFYPNSHYLHRVVVIFLTFSPTFIILTISYEGLFYFVYCMTVVTWVRLEHTLYRYGLVTRCEDGSGDSDKAHGTYRALTTSDARLALFFFFLLQSAFFSTGNIASISSFSLDSVQRLIPVFNPFSQGALLMFKILVPFAIISANLGILNRRLNVAPSALFMLVMAVSDILTLNFFYMVKDEGSWLDIGTTISHFCIASGLCTFVAGLEFLSEVFVSGVEFELAIEGTAGPTAAASRLADQAIDKVADAVIDGNDDNGVVGPGTESGTAKHDNAHSGFHLPPTTVLALMLEELDFRLRRVRRQIAEYVSSCFGDESSMRRSSDEDKIARDRKLQDRHASGVSRWTRHIASRLVMLCVVFFFCADYLIFTLNSLRWPASPPTYAPPSTESGFSPALIPSIQKVYISATHWNSAAILQNHWSAAVLDLIRNLGPQNVYVSIYESGSWDTTKDLLRGLEKQLSDMGVENTVVLDETTHMDIVNQPEPPSISNPEGWVRTPRGKREVRRIPYLASVRNKSLDPLQKMNKAGRKFDRILFLNDIIFTTADVINLLNTRNGSYAAACALDFARENMFYDSFALRDLNGKMSYSSYYPYVTSRLGRTALSRGEAVPVQSCWNGIAAFDAAPFQVDKRKSKASSKLSSERNHELAPLRFRAIPDSLAAHHVEGSECCLIHYDNPLSQKKGVWINPHVRVGYNPIAYASVRSFPMKSEAIFGWFWSIMASAMGLPWRNGNIDKQVALWKAEDTNNYEPGVACLTYEMQVIVWNGWAHV